MDEMQWKTDLTDHGQAHVDDYMKRNSIEEGTSEYGAIKRFWKERGPLIINQVEWTIDDLVDASTDVQMQDIGMLIARDSKIDDFNENTLRIVQHLQDLRKELAERDIDYDESEGEEVPGLDEEESTVEERPPAKS